MTEPNSEALRTAAAHWSSQAVRGWTLKNWWEHPAIVRYVNRRICGFPLDGLMTGDVVLITYLQEADTARRAVSVGCGGASKEITLLRRDVVDHFDLYEISEARIEEGRKSAETHGLSDRITWHNEPADFNSTRGGGFDLVYWNNSLHHMLDTRRALEWSKAVLAPRGLLYLNDFVGPDRMQWPDEMLRAATRVRETLPARLLELPNGGSLPVEAPRPDPAALEAMDPTECADSAAIVPAFEELFAESTVRPTGGVVYHLALKGILERLGPGDESLLDLLLLVDKLHSKAGMTHYAVAFNRRS